MEHAYARRREDLRAAMHKEGLDALLVSAAAGRYYFSGFELHDPQFNESAGHLLVTAQGDDWLCTDSRYLDAARRLWPEERIFIYRGSAFKEFGAFFSDRVRGVLGFEAQTLSLASWEVLSHHLRGVTFKPADALARNLRQRKDADEILRMRRSCALNERLMQWLPSQIVEGETETAISWKIERYFRENGASELAFANIVAYGHNAALPHAIPSADVFVRAGAPLLVDVGCRLDGYCSDQTRTFWIGEKPSDVFTHALELVQEAQRRAIAVIRPGVRACDVFAEAYNFFVKHGVEKAFTHGLGHGVGLETHEAPSLNSRNEQLLEPGMVVTVEPGLYYPEWGGIRWEHMVLVTEDGADILG